MSAYKSVSLLSKYGATDLKFINWYPLCSSLLNTLGSQQVRYRKPRWIPKAESKIYKVTGRKRLEPREFAENLRLYQQHKFYLRLTYDYLDKQNSIKYEKGLYSDMMRELDEKEHRRLMDFNDKENERLAKLRDESMNVERDRLLLEILEFKQKEAESDMIYKEKALQTLADMESLVQTFIGVEDLEKAIEFAMDHPSDHNFSIDTVGRVYKGRKTLPHLVDKDTLPSLPIVDGGRTTDIIF